MHAPISAFVQYPKKKNLHAPLMSLNLWFEVTFLSFYRQIKRIHGKYLIKENAKHIINNFIIKNL
jgi:hypothetical protein